MKRLCAVAVFLSCLSIQYAKAQGPYQPFGVDAENLDVRLCGPTIGCPFIDLAAHAGAQWIRLYAIWSAMEPSLLSQWFVR